MKVVLSKRSKKILASIVTIGTLILGFQNCGQDGMSSDPTKNASSYVDPDGNVLIPGATPTPTPGPGAGPGPGPGPGGATPSPTPATPGSALTPISTTVTANAVVNVPFEVRFGFAKTGTATINFSRTSTSGPLTVNLTRLLINGTGALNFGFVGSVNVTPAGNHTEVVTFNAPTAAGNVTQTLTYTLGGVPRTVTLVITVTDPDANAALQIKKQGGTFGP